MPKVIKPVYVILEMEMARQGFSHKMLAEKIGIAAPTLSKSLKGERDWMLSECYKILEVLMLSKAMLPEVFPCEKYKGKKEKEKK